jgi:Zn-dependent protease with chaperone function
MKSCSPNGGAAYSRPVPALVETTRKAPLENKRGCLLGRSVFVERFALILCASLCFATASRGSSDPTPSAHPETPAVEASPQRDGAPQNSPLELKTSEQTRTEQYTLSHERQAKAVAYSRAGYALYFASYFFGGLFLFLILRLGWAAKFREIAENASDKKWVQGLVFVPLLFLTIDVLELPLRLYWHALSLHYEQSIQGWGSWFWDWTKGESLDTAFGIVLVLILYAVMRRSPRHWWFYFWFPAVLILLGLMVITPLVIDPLFNKFEPLGKEHADLVTSIEKLSKHAGVPIPPERMFLMVASQKTNAINAYVTGLGASKRVVIWDTTIQKTSNEESLFIVGHELGHYVLGHVRQGFLMGAAGLLLALYFLFQGLHWALDRWAKDWKLCGQEDLASLAVLLLLLQLLLFVSSPVISGYSRMQEHAADVYGLEVIHGLVPNSEEVAAHAFQVLGELDLSDPNPPPFITFWLYSHPPLAERLVFAHSYDPWSKGESPKYVK